MLNQSVQRLLLASAIGLAAFASTAAAATYQPANFSAVLQADDPAPRPAVDPGSKDALRDQIRALRRRARAGDAAAIEKLQQLRERLRERRGDGERPPRPHPGQKHKHKHKHKHGQGGSDGGGHPPRPAPPAPPVTPPAGARHT